MTKPSRSIGLDDAGRHPRGAPEGPYITDRSDDSRRRAGPGRKAGRQPAAAQPQAAPDPATRRKGPAQP
jgi:hypothetical protein